MLAIIPCSGTKLAVPAPARQLYTGSLFLSCLRAAEALLTAGEVTGVRVLSALHGLVALDTVLEPYDVTVGDERAIPVVRLAGQMVGLPGPLTPLLPARYDELLREAAGRAGVEVGVNPLSGSRGIFEMRGRLRRIQDRATPALF